MIKRIGPKYHERVVAKMKINMTQINRQVKQLREQSTNLRAAQTSLLTYHRNLQAHWKGMEMDPVNQAISDYSRSLATIATEIDSISSEVLLRAQILEEAQEALIRAEADRNRTQSTLSQVQTRVNATEEPSASLLAELNTAKDNHNRAVSVHNSAAARVRELS